jgi:predicted porin
MQKKLIALAVAGLVSAPAFAQSNVTIYGVADAGLGIGDHGSNDFQGVISGVLSGSRIGFKGSEDLGNGMKAVFQLEQGFDIGNGAEHREDRTFSRQSWVGLSGAFGTVGLGYQYAPGYFANYDALNAALISPQSTLTNGLGMTITPNSPARWDNSVTYTGKFEALTVRGNYSMQGQENTDFELDPITSEVVEIDAEDDDAAGLGIDYTNGPLSVGVVYHWLSGPDLVDSTLAGDVVEGDDTQ